MPDESKDSDISLDDLDKAPNEIPEETIPVFDNGDLDNFEGLFANLKTIPSREKESILKMKKELDAIKIVALRLNKFLQKSRKETNNLSKALSNAEETIAKYRDEADYEKQQARGIKILNDLMEKFADRIFYFMCAYCGFAGALLLVNATGIFTRPISDSVFHFLVGSTAVTVIGLVATVVSGIFLGARKGKDPRK